MAEAIVKRSDIVCLFFLICFFLTVLLLWCISFIHCQWVPERWIIEHEGKFGTGKINRFWKNQHEIDAQREEWGNDFDPEHVVIERIMCIRDEMVPVDEDLVHGLKELASNDIVGQGAGYAKPAAISSTATQANSSEILKVRNSLFFA